MTKRERDGILPKLSAEDGGGQNNLEKREKVLDKWFCAEYNQQCSAVGARASERRSVYLVN